MNSKVKALQEAIEKHKRALVVAQQESDAATKALEDYQRQEIEVQRRFLPPGRAKFFVLEPSGERDQLERERVAASAKVNALGQKIDMLRQALEAAQR